MVRLHFFNLRYPSPTTGQSIRTQQKKLSFPDFINRLMNDVGMGGGGGPLTKVSISTRSYTRATPVCPVKNTSTTHSPELRGWDFSWLEMLVARLPPYSSHSSSSNQSKSQPFIFGEYVGLVFPVTRCWGFWCHPAI